MCVTGIEQPAEQNQERSQYDDPEEHGDPAHRHDAQNVEKSGGPDDPETDDQSVVDDLGEKERGIGDEQDGIDCKVEKGIQPGPPTFKESPAEPKGVLDPLIIPAGYRHEAVEFEDG